MRREAIAIDPDDIDIAGAGGNAFIEDASAFIDHCREDTQGDLVRWQARTRIAAARGIDDALRLGVGQGRAAAALIAVNARTTLLSEPSSIDDRIGQRPDTA